MMIVIISVYVYNVLPCIKCSARTSVIHCLALLKIVHNFELYHVLTYMPLLVLIRSTELVNKFTTEDDHWMIDTCLHFKVVVHFQIIVCNVSHVYLPFCCTTMSISLNNASVQHCKNSACSLKMYNNKKIKFKHTYTVP